MATTKTKKRTKASVEPELSWAQVQKELGEYAGVTDMLAATEVELESKLNAVRQEYQEKITDLKAKQSSLLKIVQKWAERNKKTSFSDKKSKQFLFGKLGFRTGTHKLKTVKGVKWADVLEKIKKLAPDYLRTKEEVAKDKLLADRENEGIVSVYESLGVKVVQEESFFIELKAEETESEV